MKNQVIISNLRKKITAELITVSCTVLSDLDCPSELWFEVEKDNPSSSDVTPYLNWAVVALLFPSMLKERDIHIEGTVSKKLIYNLNKVIQPYLHAFDSNLKVVNITASNLTTEVLESEATKIGTGFSAGIDSFATLLENSGKTNSPYNITHLCIFNVGAFANRTRPGVDEFFSYSSNRAKKFANTNGYKFLSVNSNIDYFFPTQSPFASSHTLRNVSASMVFEGFFNSYLYSSGYAPSISLDIRPTHDIAFMDPILVPLLGTENIQIVSSCAGMSRFEKTTLVGRSQLANKDLDCCASSIEKRIERKFRNCCMCKKCGRTMTVLDALGVLADFREVFDIQYFKMNRKKIHADIYARALAGNERDREIIKETKNIGYRLSGRKLKNISYFFDKIFFRPPKEYTLKIIKKYIRRKPNVF